MARKSFWQKITGAVRVDDIEEEFEEFADEFQEEDYNLVEADGYTEEDINRQEGIVSSPSMDLPVDLYQDEEHIYIEAFIPGVSIDDLDIELSREYISISGVRQKDSNSNAEYLIQELSWGEFSKAIELPEEVDIDSSRATENGGVLKITLPKFNKLRKAKLTVKSAKR